MHGGVYLREHDSGVYEQDRAREERYEGRRSEPSCYDFITTEPYHDHYSHDLEKTHYGPLSGIYLRLLHRPPETVLGFGIEPFDLVRFHGKGFYYPCS